DAKQVGDRAPAQGEDRGQGQEEESAMDRARERRFEGVEDGADLLGQLLVEAFQLPPCGAGLARLMSSQGPEPMAELLGRESRGGRIGYSRHGRPPWVRSGVLNTHLIAPRRLASRTPETAKVKLSPTGFIFGQQTRNQGAGGPKSPTPGPA